MPGVSHASGDAAINLPGLCVEFFVFKRLEIYFKFKLQYPLRPRKRCRLSNWNREHYFTLMKEYFRGEPYQGPLALVEGVPKDLALWWDVVGLKALARRILSYPAAIAFQQTHLQVSPHPSASRFVGQPLVALVAHHFDLISIFPACFSIKL